MTERRGARLAWVALLAAAFAAAPAHGGEAVRPQVGFDFDRQPKTPFEVFQGFNIGSELRLDSDYESNFDLDDSVSDHLGTIQPRGELYLSYEPFDWAQVYTRFQFAHEFALSEDAEGNNSGTAVDLEELYLLLPDIWDGVTVQIGRQDTEDPREWLFDQEFDALRVYWRESPFGVQGFVGGISAFPRRLDEADRDDDTINYFLGGYYAPNEESQIGVYGFFRDDHGSDNESPYFLGVQARGRTDFNLGYWLEAAYVGGDDGANSVHGYGVDVGLFYIADLPMRPTITGGFAYGSGDDDLSDGEDGNFRQTGLQDNNSRFHGVTAFSVYGELFNPELSNMEIFTAGLGIRPTTKSSFDVVYHHYRQAVAVPMLRDVNIDPDPNGVSKHLGDEVDFVVGIRDIKNLRIELIGAIFFPGDAFPGADNAYLGEIEFKYKF
jgi:alginate production protein